MDNLRGVLFQLHGDLLRGPKFCVRTMVYDASFVTY